MTKIAVSLWNKCLISYGFPSKWGFLQYFSELGLELVPLSDETADILVCFDHYDSNIKRLPWFDKSSRMLICFEPRAVHPRQHQEKIRRKYGVTIVASPHQVILPSDRVVLPGTLPVEPISQPSPALRHVRKANTVGVLNENKFSFVPGNLYKYRVLAIEHLIAQGISVHLGGGTWTKGILFDFWRQLLALGSLIRHGLKFDLRQVHFGIHKNKNLFLHGRVPDVLEFYRNFEYALVIENDPDYVSEKLFNAIQAGCIPLYKGPSLQDFGLPPAIAVEISDFPLSISQPVQNLTKEMKEKVLAAGQSLIEDETERQKWTQERYSRELAREIQEFSCKRTLNS